VTAEMPSLTTIGGDGLTRRFSIALSFLFFIYPYSL
jgi:hypothetical protein